MTKKELAESLAEVSNKCAKPLGLKYNFEVDLSGDNPAVIENTIGVGLEVFDGEVNSISGPKPAIQYRGLILSFDPGSRWDPPSTDIESTDDVVTSFNQAVEYLVTRCVAREVVDHLDYLAMGGDEEG